MMMMMSIPAQRGSPQCSHYCPAHTMIYTVLRGKMAQRASWSSKICHRSVNVPVNQRNTPRCLIASYGTPGIKGKSYSHWHKLFARAEFICNEENKVTQSPETPGQEISLEKVMNRTDTAALLVSCDCVECFFEMQKISENFLLPCWGGQHHLSNWESRNKF